MRNRIKMKNQAIGGGSLVAELLWTNPNPSATFNAQTINLDLSSYKKIIITNKLGVSLNVYYANEIYKNVQSGIGNYAESHIRGVLATNTQIEITDAYNSSQSSNKNNNSVIPYKIYGLK